MSNSPWRSRLPFGALFVAAVSGISAAQVSPWGVRLWLAVSVVTLLLWLWRQRSVWCLVFVASVFGTVHVWQTRASASEILAAELAGRTVDAQVEGRVIAASPRGFVLRVERLQIGDRTWRAALNLLVASRQATPRRGERIAVSGRLAAIPPRRNPAGFDARSWLWLRGITCEMRVIAPGDLRVLSGPPPWGIFDAADAVREWSERTLRLGIEDAPVAANLLSGMVLGITGSIPDPLKDDFRRTGTFHLFSVSGLHVGMISLILWQALRLLRVPRRVAACAIIPALFFYALMVGWKPASVRAAVMASVFLVSLVVSRRPVPLNSLAAAGFVILAQDTREFFNPGFQLSFLVVAAILVVYDPVDSFLKARWRPDPFLPRQVWTRLERVLFTVSGVAAGSVAVSLAAWLGSLPLMLVYFHLVSPSALIANIWVVPVAFLIMVVAMSTLAAGLVSTWLAAVFNNANWLFLNGLAAGVSWMASWPGASFYIGEPARQSMGVTAFDLQSGGAIAVEYGGRLAFIDAGSAYHQRATLSPWLNAHGRVSPDTLLISHGDAQHVGGVKAWLRQPVPKRIFDSVVKDRSPVRRDIHRSLAEAGIPKSLVRSGDRIELLPGLMADVLHPAGGLRPAKADDGVIILRWEAEGVRFLCLGDAGPEACARLLELPSDELRADVLLLGLPRSGEPPPLDLLAAIRPVLVVAGGAAAVRHLRWDEKWLDQVRRSGARVFRQEETGAVEMDIQRGRLRARGVLNGASFESAISRSGRFDMNGHIADPIAAGEKGIFDLMGDDVAGGHRGLAVDPHVDVRDEGEAAFTDPALFDIDDAFDIGRSAGDLGDDLLRSLLVEEFADAPPQHPDAVDSNDHTREERGPVVGNDPRLPAQQSQ